MQNFFEILPEKSGTAIALGYFDGLHKGHRNVISLAAAEKKNGLIPVCFTFSKSPKSVLYGTQSNALMTNEDKIKTLERLGIERTYQADFEKIMNMPAKDFASQGQVRSIAVALKLAEAEMITEKSGDVPIVILDDVLSELDEFRRSFIINHIEKFQIFITSCNLSDTEKFESGKIWNVSDGKFTLKDR